MKYQSVYNYQPEEGEHNSEPSMTVPGQSMSVSEMLTRYTNGMPILLSPGTEWPEEDEEEPLPKINDLTDHEAIQQTILEIRGKSKAILEKQRIAKQKADQKKLEDEIRAKIKSESQEKDA